MKKILLWSLSASIFFVSCEKQEVKTPVSLQEDKISLSKQTYLIRLNPAFAKEELEGISDFDERNDKVKQVIKNTLNDLGLSHIPVEATFNTVFVGFCTSLLPSEYEAIKSLHIVADIALNGEVSINAKSSMVSTSAAQTVPWGITRVGKADGTGKRAFVLDTGIDLNHDDLNVNVPLSRYFVQGQYSYYGVPDDQHGHGTHVAGTIAALDNNIGVVGVAYGAEVVAIQVLTASGNGDIVGVTLGIDYVAAVGLPGDVANMSLTGGANSILDYAVISASAKGIYFTLAAGNDRRDADNYSPARANGPNIFTVSAMNSSDNWASFSNYGSDVDYCAPGVSVYSCNKNNGYRYMSGTSMAAPHVAGLLLITNGNLRTDGTVNNDPDGNADPIAHK